MAVGQGVLVGNLSYLSFGREITYGAYVTGTAALNFMSASLKMTKETKILEEIQTSRTNSNSIGLGRSVEGEVEYIFSPMNLACNYLLQNAFGGGPVTTATATGETVGGLGFQHTIDIANFAATYSSLSCNMRKGQATDGKVFEYCGLRVNELTMKAELDEPLVMSVSMIGKDASITSNDISSSIVSTTNQQPLSFVNGRFSVENSPGSLTSTSFWHVQSFEFKLSNNLNADSGARRIGSDTLQVLPAGMAQFELKATMRFDTTTAYAAMVAGTRLAGEFEFKGDTMTGSAIQQGLKVTMPYLIITDAGDPEVGGPGDQLTSEVTFAVLRDPTAAGYAVKAVVTNLTSTYV